MRVTVKMFAAAREAVGSEVVVNVNDAATVADLRTVLITEYPRLSPLMNHAMFAVNTRYAHDTDVLTSEDEIACIPPVSGG